MKQLTFIKPGVFEWHDVRAPVLQNGAQALVRPLAVTRCDLDLYIATGVFPMPGPFAFGHEIAGEVIDVGEDVVTVVPGDRVIVPFQISCGTCRMCQRGLTNACLSVPPYSAYGLAPSSGTDWGGGLSDCVRVPFADAMLVKLPEGLSLVSAAAMSDNAVDGYRTVAAPLLEYPGTDVLVVGGLAQSVGLYAVKAALALGAGRVVYRDFDARRLAVAKSMGADTIETVYARDMSVTEQFSITVDAAGIPDALSFVLKSTAPCGICTGVSAGSGTVAEVPLRQMYMKGITYTVSRVHARTGIKDIIDCGLCHDLHAHGIVDATRPFSEAADAMAEGNTKTVFLAE